MRRHDIATESGDGSSGMRPLLSTGTKKKEGKFQKNVARFAHLAAANFQLTGLSAAKIRTKLGTSSSLVQRAVFLQRLFDRTLNRLSAIHSAHTAWLFFDRPY
ncbi:hypothetical protein N7510_010402 [Penicillium lagena]|uniref:uncharacterized protein n=1 Tax=Penicillium lagena TaxID=94218 RepID=UPI002541A78F|nr:uncharacterized protein N7510_010402 [Penicillium lagena]KAJ5605248.1 hypothetical protein N7510_010402 [Penicillium lagena]